MIDQGWKLTAAQAVRKMSKEDALATIARANAAGHTIHVDAIRELTGGYVSQAINFHVMRLLGKRAGIIRSKS